MMRTNVFPLRTMIIPSAETNAWSPIPGSPCCDAQIAKDFGVQPHLFFGRVLIDREGTNTRASPEVSCSDAGFSA